MHSHQILHQVSTPSRFQDFAVRNQPFFIYFSVAILSVL